MLATLLVVILCVVAALTFRIFDTDVWQHLAVGRALWEQRSIPSQQIWIWPTWGEPYVLPSWLFRAALWPFWEGGGLGGLYAWRWLTTLLVFALVWDALRRQGARGFVVIPVLVIAVLVYRQRSMPRPETLAALLLAIELWILESARRGGHDHTIWLVPVACAWANAHISWYFGLLVLGVYALGTSWPTGAALTREGPAPPARMLWLVLAACVAVSFLNPFGARALMEPFQFLFEWRNDPMYRTIGEFQPPDWRLNARNGLALLLIAWPILQVWRARRGLFDAVEGMLFVLLSAAVLISQRFIGPWVIVAGFFVARDLDAWARTRRWPSWTHPPRARAALASAACVLFTAFELTHPDYVRGLGVIRRNVPEAAADFIERHGIRGRSFNQFEFGGYLLWRFWPDRERLPFAPMHPEAMRPADRQAYAQALTDPAGWATLDGRYRFDWVLVKTAKAPGVRLLEHVDGDSAFALVFTDDASALYLRRGGRWAARADSLRYRLLPGGEDRLPRVWDLVRSDPGAADLLEHELRRIRAETDLDSWASSVLVELLRSRGRANEARALADSARLDGPPI